MKVIASVSETHGRGGVAVVIVRCAWVAVLLSSTATSQTVAPAPRIFAAGNANPLNATVLGQRGIVATLPTGKAATQGFTATIEFPQSKLPGYMPISVSLLSNTTFTRDRQLVLRLEPLEGGHSPAVNLFSVDLPLRIDQGTTQLNTTHLIPRWSVGNAYRLELMENNQTLDEYTTEVGELNMRYASIPSQELMSESDGQWVYIQGSDADVPPDVREICSAVSGLSLMSLPDPKADPWYWNNIASAGYFRSLPIASLSNDWRSYQSCDAVLMSKETLASLREGRTAEFKALRDWLLCGGTVVLTDVGDVDALARLVGVTAGGSRNVRLDLESLAKEAPNRLLRQRQVMKEALDFVSSGTLGQGLAAYTADHVPGWTGIGDAAYRSELNLVLPTLPKLVARLTSDIRRCDRIADRNPAQWKVTFCMMDVAGGRLIGLREEVDSESTRLIQWQVVSDLIGYHKSAMLRRGVDPILGDSRARRWMIPGVAEPPVYTFMGLLSVFVILVGPIAYRRTSRQGRSHLMFAIAPALALATTALMFGYGIVADGFGTSTRIRQLTWVDGASGDAGQRVRATYFAGIRPGNGLRFPADAEVMHYPDPYGQSWEAIHGKSAGILGRVRIDDSQQRFDSSFLPSRQQKQFVFHRPRSGVGSLSLISEPSSAVLSSSLEIELREVIVRDAAGNYWTCEKMGAGQTEVDCDPLTTREASKRLGELYLQYRPLSRIVDGSDQSRRRMAYQNQTLDLMTGALRKLNAIGTTNALEGLFEQRLQQWLQTDGTLPLSSFVALSNVTDDVVSVEGATLIESVHYIFGTLKQ